MEPSSISSVVVVDRKNIAEARAEIEGAVRMQVTGGYYESDSNSPSSSSSSSSSSANSYKMKLEQRRAMQQRTGGAATATTTAVLPPTLPPPPSPVAPSYVEPPMVDIPSRSPDARMTSSPPPAQASRVGLSAPPNPASSRTFAAAAAAAPPSAATAPPSAATDEEDVRREIRTLQGLLLKHRGGPGFGAGRLRAPEAQKLEDKLRTVKSILRAEVSGSSGSAPPALDPAAKAESRPATSQAVTAFPPPIRTIPPPQPPPPPVQTSARAATIVPPPATFAAPTMTVDPLAGSVACVEAVLKMYKESSPSEREAMIIPLREAFMAAASASNKYIAESELGAHRAAMEAGPMAALSAIEENSVSASPIMGFPTTYAVTNPYDDEEVQVNAGGRAENDKKLEDVYNALLHARGEGGKLGLKNVSGDEAKELADKLVMMRSVLLDELNN